MGQSQRRVEEGGFAGGGVKGRFFMLPSKLRLHQGHSRAFVIDLFMTEQTGLMSNVFQSTKDTSLHNGLLSRSS